jgi:GMP synthase-like glutamine amidotransferase
MSSSAPGTILSVLQNRGIDPRIIFTASEDISNFDPLAPDLLVVLGGAPGVYQSEEYPFLKDEAKVLEKRLAADKPTLGICLGAQLMAGCPGSACLSRRSGPGNRLARDSTDRGRAIVTNCPLRQGPCDAMA